MLLPRTPPAVLLLVSTSLLAAPPATAAPPPAYLVRDVATGTPLPYLPTVRYKVELVQLGDRLYFSAEDGIHGRELWSTDGTAAGTTLVADVCPGYCYGWASELTVVGDRLFFYGDDDAHGAELWVTDGTAEGTRLVADIMPGLDSSSPSRLTAAGDRLFFTARDPEHGPELWVSDGTAAGTRRVADLKPGAHGSDPDRLTALAGGVFFAADDGVHGREPWFSDGTAAGTVLLADVRTGSERSIDTAPPGFVGQSSRDWGSLGGHRVVFAALDDTHGFEPWTTDGTPGGTALLADLATDGATGSSSPRGFAELDGRLYFSARTPAEGGELWSTDGVADTHVVTELAAGNPSWTSATPLGSAGGWLYFRAYTDALGSELWRTDGTAANTHLVADAVPGPAGSLDWTFLTRGAALGFRFVYFSETPDAGVEPWITDGTTAGTTLLADIFPGEGWSNPLAYVEVAVLDDRAFLFAFDPATGYEPWTTDGTAAGTQMLADLDTQVSALVPCFWFHCSDLGAAGDRLFAGFHDPQHGEEPWMSRGTGGTTNLVVDLEPATSQGYPAGSFPWGFAGVGSVALFSAQTGGFTGLWRSDGSEAGTWTIPGPQDPIDFTSALGAVFFRGSTADAGSELWVSDGDEAGTRMVADVNPGTEGSGPNELTEAAGRLFFSAWDGDAGWELWASDGSEASTARVADLWAGPDSAAPRSLTATGDRLFFSAETPGAGRELGVSDGTEEGTRRVLDLLPGAEAGMKGDSEPGIVALPQIAAGDGGAFFLADDGVHGTEPWWSDGSEAGTRSLGDLRPGSDSSRPRFLTSAGGRAFFAADDGVRGRELWTSDSTEAGTEMVLDLYPGPEPSTPEFLTVAGRRLFFTANDGEHGFEPWALLLPGRLPRLSLHVDGSFLPGGVVQLTAVLLNPPPVPMPDGDGDELVLPLPPELQFLGGEATSGELGFQDPAGAAAAGQRTAAATTIGGGTLTWNGALAAGGSVTVTARARILPGVPPGTVLTLAGEGWLDSDEDGTSDFRFAGDDPGQPGDEDPATVVVAPQVLDVPALDAAGLAVLALLLAAVALRRLAG